MDTGSHLTSLCTQRSAVSKPAEMNYSRRPLLTSGDRDACLCSLSITYSTSFMNLDAMLDTPYCLHGRMVTSIKSSHSMAVFAGGKAFELSLDLFQVLMTFAEKKTPRQAFAVLDTDVNLDSFREIVS